MSDRKSIQGKLIAIPLLCWATSTYAAAPDYTGLAGPAIFLWAITHPIETIKGLAEASASQRRLEAFRLAITQCEAEEKLLPKSLEIDSFIDEGASLTGDLIYELLLKRNVKAIYVQPHPTDDGKSLRYGRGLTISKSSDQKGSKYIKLELAREEDGNCLSGIAQERYKVPPALPRTCVAYSFTDAPQTRHSLRYGKTQEIAGEQFGMWSIEDLESKKAVASLTTVDLAPHTVNSGGAADCRSPYTMLVWRIKPSPSKNNPFFVNQSIVVASPSFLDLIAQRDALPLIPTRTAKTPFKEGEWGADVSQTAIHARWQDAVDEAKRSRIGHYEGQGFGYRFSSDYRIYEGAHGKGRLLDWSQTNLIGLQLVETGTQIRTGINWDVSASEGGFLVFTNDWGKNKNQLVARYNIGGTLDWAVQIPGVPEIKGCGFGPRRAWATDTEIVLSQPSCNNKEGNEWRLQKGDIPLYRLPIARSSRLNTSSRQAGEP